MSVLPPASKDHVPVAFQELMINSLSPIKEFYPLDFGLDLNGKKNSWEAVVLIPFIDQVSNTDMNTQPVKLISLPKPEIVFSFSNILHFDPVTVVVFAVNLSLVNFIAALSIYSANEGFVCLALIFVYSELFLNNVALFSNLRIDCKMPSQNLVSSLLKRNEIETGTEIHFVIFSVQRTVAWWILRTKTISLRSMLMYMFLSCHSPM